VKINELLKLEPLGQGNTLSFAAPYLKKRKFAFSFESEKLFGK